MDLPLGLSTALESRNCVLFVGAGAGFYAQNEAGLNAPTADELAASTAQRFGVERHGEGLDKVAQVAEIRNGRDKVLAYLDSVCTNFEPDDDLRWLANLPWRAIFTTNYDNVLERCFETSPDARRNPVSFGIDSEIRSWDPNLDIPIFHLHGRLNSPGGREAILLTEQDYVTFRSKRSMMFEQFKILYASVPILYFGYGNLDTNWRELTSELRAQFAPSEPPLSYRVSPTTGELDREILRNSGIITLDGKLNDFRQAVEAQLGTLTRDSPALAFENRSVPSDLGERFSENPAAVIRLLNSWEYVNQAPFEEPPNLGEFLKGDRPNWGLVSQGLNFERDLEKPLAEMLYDEATSPNSQRKTHAHIVLGPAGYGQTTLLKAVAAWFAKGKTGATVLFLKPGSRVIEGDVEYAVRNLPSPVIFFVDDAADNADELASAVKMLRNAELGGFFLMAERINEWRQRVPQIRPYEHLIEPLSDAEIARLLDRLEYTNSLGVLKDLSDALRFSAVKNKNQQELLVTMREVTEGRAFDAIVEDEYQNVRSANGRELYALAAIFSRHRCYARDTLCADVLDVNVADLYTTLADETAGAVVFEEVGGGLAIQAARTRHHVIADIVWYRCLDDASRESLLSSALKSLNLNFGIDARAFEAFTRDDDAIDGIRGLEEKIRFFEEAVRKDPRNAYVKQHYARMLRREGKLDFALGQIEQAIEMAPRTRVLQHTRGVILKDMATDASQIEGIARRRMTQSEDSLRRTINMSPRDHFGYVSLAELYLDWSRVAFVSSDEAVRYIAKAQEIVFDGLALARDREGLYLVSSKIESVLKNDEAKIAALRNALVVAPSSPISRYLLGSSLLARGSVTQAIEVLTEGVRMHPEDPRLCAACAIAMYADGANVDSIVAILRLARNKGSRDYRFMAILAGMLLISGEAREAREIYTQARQRTLSIGDRDRVAFQALSNGGDAEWEGLVVTIRSGFGFVQVNGLGDVYCPPKFVRDFALRESNRVKLQVGFTFRGPVVTAIALLDT